MTSPGFSAPASWELITQNLLCLRTEQGATPLSGVLTAQSGCAHMVNATLSTRELVTVMGTEHH